MPIALLWAFSLEGSIDLINALCRNDAVPHLGVMWVVPTFFVPLLLVTHFYNFVHLVRGGVSDSPFGSEPV